MSGKALISGQAGVAVLLHGGRAQSFHLDGPAGLDRRWEEIPQIFGDGGNVDRPALQRLLSDIQAGTVRCVVVYKVDRLSRSLIDFARIIEVFEKHNVSFVSVTQQFNTTNSLGRLTLNILLSFAQFEREIIAERTRDKMWAARRKGKWIGGHPMLGYDIDPGGGRLVINPDEAHRVRTIFELYLDYQALLPVVREIDRRGWRTKQWVAKRGKTRGGKPFTKGLLFRLLTNPTFSSYRYYVCVQAQQRGWANCETKSVSAPAIEAAVVQQIRKIGSDPRIVREALKKAETQRRGRITDLTLARLSQILSHFLRRRAVNIGRN